jgi:hypothetical protein
LQSLQQLSEEFLRSPLVAPPLHRDIEHFAIPIKELAQESGLSVNTLLSRKHYAVLHLRQRLQAIYNEFTET